MSAAPRPMEARDYLFLAILAGIWGASFLFIKVAVGEMAPAFMVFLRTGFGALTVLVALRVFNVPLAGMREYWRAGLVISIFNAALPYTLFGLGETYIASSLAGILNATLPLWTAILAPLWVEAEGIGRRQVTGLALGFGGVVVLAHPTGSVLGSNLLGIALLLCATLSYAFASHYSRRAFPRVPAMVPAFMQCVGAVIILFPLAVVFRPHRLPSATALGAVAALGIGGTGIAMVLAYDLIRRIGAARTSVVTYLLPPFALFYGVLLLHEHVDLPTLGALVLVLAGVFLITRGRRESRVSAPAVDAAPTVAKVRPR